MRIVAERKYHKTAGAYEQPYPEMVHAMSKAFAEINPAGDKIEVHFRYDPDLVRSIKEVPGAGSKSHPAEGGPMWLVPSTSTSAVG
jgi:hypothetical protein